MRDLPNRLQLLLSSMGGQIDDINSICLLDCYNQAIWQDITPSLTARMPDSSNYFVLEINEGN